MITHTRQVTGRTVPACLLTEETASVLPRRTVIVADAPSLRSTLAELWKYRELLFFLTWRDIKVRYRQTLLGAMWALIQPLVTMLVLVIFLGRLAGTASVPYPLFVLSGLIPWMLFAGTINALSQSVVGQRSLIERVYFPRLLIPLGATGAPMADYCIASCLLSLGLAFVGYLPSWMTLLLPFFGLCLAMAAIGMGCLLAAATVRYRDIRYLIPFLLQLGLFATPCIYLSSEKIVGGSGRLWMALNPAFGLITGGRAVLLGMPVDWAVVGISAGCGLAVFLLGCWYFQSRQRSFADEI